MTARKIVQIDGGGNDVAEFLNFTDILLELFVFPQIILRLLRRVAIAHCIKPKKHDRQQKNEHQDCKRDEHAANNLHDFLRSHELASAMEVEAGKIVDEWRVEEQAIESIEYAAMSGQNVGCVLCARTTFESALCEVAEDDGDSRSEERRV